MFNYVCQTGKRKTEGVEILRYRVSLPEFPELARISKFYRDIYELAVSYCESELTNIAEKEYSECSTPGKKFHYAPIFYSLDGQVTHEDNDTLFVKLTAKITKRDLPLYERKAYDAHAWSKNDEMLLPPRHAARLFMKPADIPRGLRGENGFLVENGRYHICSKNEITEIPLSRNKKS